MIFILGIVIGVLVNMLFEMIADMFHEEDEQLIRKKGNQTNEEI